MAEPWQMTQAELGMLFRQNVIDELQAVIRGGMCKLLVGLRSRTLLPIPTTIEKGGQ